MCLHCWKDWGSKVVNQITFDPLLPLYVLALVAGVSLVFVSFSLWRGLNGWWLRAGTAMILLLALFNPSLRQEERNPLSDVVIVVVDETSSQSVSVRPEQIAEAVDKLAGKLGNLENFETKTVVVRDAPDGADDGTLLIAALAEATAEVARSRIAGAIIVSDGQVHDMALAPDFPAPVHLLLTGEQSDWDRRLIVKNAPAFAILGQPVTLKLKVEDQGRVPLAVQGQTALTIAVDGGRPQTFRVRVGEDLELPLTLPHGGANVLQFEVPEVAGELTDRNNTAVVSINGVRDRLRVLLVSGEPHAGERTWRNLLKSDSAVDLVHFTILRPPGKQDGVPVSELSLIAFPTRELFLDKIKEFDLIIFDRYRRRGILPSIYLDNVSKYVSEGGAVLVVAGPAFAGVESLYRSPLSRILPARPTARVFEEGFVPRISDIGRRHPVTEELQNHAPRAALEDGTPGWGRWFRMVDTDMVSGHALMTGPDGGTLLILDRVGQGRLAMLTSDQAWLWHRGFEGGGPQLELLRRLAHWMMKEPELEEEDLRAVSRAGKVTVTRRSLLDVPRELTITDPDGSLRSLAMEEVSPGRYVAQFEGDENGLYRLTDGVLDSVVALGPAAAREFEETISTGDVLAPLIKATNGGVHRLDQGAPALRMVREGRVASGRGWIGLTPRNAFVTTDIRLIALAPVWLLLLLGGLMIVGAWRFEGR